MQNRSWSAHWRVIAGATLLTALGGCSSSAAPITTIGDDAAAEAETPSCATNETSCNGVCASLADDAKNCGACGKACNAGEVCSNGACAIACPAGQTVCGDKCVTTDTDNANCGACGKSCGAGEVCSAGACATSCGAGLTTCSAGGDAGAGDAGDAGSAARYCANTKTDRNDCGSCGNVCPTGQTCSNGTCALVCVSGQTACSDGQCHDLKNDVANCGACGTACPSGQVCTNGACAVSCVAGQTLCGDGKCHDLNVDNQNCGACSTPTTDKSCAAGSVCTMGTCTTSCGAGLTDCGGTCANLQSDNANCGTCGTTCGAGTMCSMGTCATTCGTGLTDCTGTCANLQSDNANCGTCGTACTGGMTCTAGKCIRGCAANADCPTSMWACQAGTCIAPLRDCAEILYFTPTATSGLYVIDPDGLNGPAQPSQVYCDMAAKAGPTTIFYATTGGDNEQPMTGDTTVVGDPHAFAAANPSRAFKAALSAIETSSVIVRQDGASLAIDHPLFDANLTVPNSKSAVAVNITAGDGTTAPAFIGYANYDIAGGGDFGISQSPDGNTCGSLMTVSGFDSHSLSYLRLNCSCQRQYFYSYSNVTPDGDGHYQSNVALGSWTTTGSCNSAEGGGLAFYAGMSRTIPSSFASCAAMHAALPSLADGVYTIDDDGAGPNPPYQAYCDMTNGGWTLLLAATPTGTLLGNNSPAWTTSGVDGTVPSSMATIAADYRGQAFDTMTTNAVKLCYQDTTHCYAFSHAQARTLLSFFAVNDSYVAYSKNILGYTDVGVDTLRDDYMNALGFSPSGYAMCNWIGINHKETSTTTGSAIGFSAIGFMGDNNCGCASVFAGGSCGTNNWLDDYALGLGLQSCADANSCSPGGTGSVNGQEHAVAGVGDGRIGPWLVFGK